MFLNIFVLALLCCSGFSDAALVNLDLPLPKFPVQVCLTSAILNVDTGTCQCPSGQYGYGDLCCAEEGMDLCVVKGDPRITSIFNVTAGLDFPCTQPVAKISNEVEGKSCGISLFTAADVADHGLLYDTSLRLEVNVGGTIKNFLLKDGKYWDPDLKSLLAFSLSVKVFDILGVKITLNYIEDIRVWQLSGCGSRITFRTPVGTAAIQTRIPGICIVSPKNTLTSTSVSDGNMCALSQSFNPAPFTKRDDALLKIMLDLSIAAGETENMDSNSTARACSNVLSFFKRCPLSRKTGAIKKCARILTDALLRRCLGGLFGIVQSLIEVFTDCIAAFCENDSASCSRLKSNNALQSCYRESQNCDRW